MDEPRIAIAASPREWAQRLHRHVADHGGALVRATVLHPRDALAEDYDVFIGDDSTSFLTRRLVDELHRRGRALLGVFDPDDPRGKGELLDLGVDEVIARGASPSEFVTAVGLLARRTRRAADPGGEASPTSLAAAGATSAGDPPQPSSTPPPHLPQHPPGRVTAVAACAGGAGATEVAIALAAACGVRGDPTVLVDGDEVAPAVAQRLGLPPYPNLRAAVDTLERRNAPPVEALLAAARGAFSVLAGLTHPQDWPQARPAETVEVVRALAAVRAQVIVNVGHRIEDVHSAGGHQRYGLSRQVLANADVVVAVALPTPVGVARLLEWLTTFRALTPRAPVHVVFNRSPSSGFKRSELVDEVTASTTPSSVWFLPADPRVESAAWAGHVVIGGPFAKATAGLAGAVLPAGGDGNPRRRRRREARR